MVRLPKLRLPSLMINQKPGKLNLNTCAPSILTVLFLAYRNKIIRLGERYRPRTVPAYEWLIPVVQLSREWLVHMTGYSKGSISAGLKLLVQAGCIGKQDTLRDCPRDGNNRFTVSEYTLFNPLKGVPLEPVDPSVSNGNLSYAYRDILVANKLQYFSVPLCLFTVLKKQGAKSIFATMGASEQLLYLTLCFLGTQQRDSQFDTTADELRTLIGLGTVTLKKAFDLLETKWLVWNSKDTFRNIRVHLRNPLTGELLRSDGVRTERDPHSNRTNYYEHTLTGSRPATFKMESKEAETLVLQLMEQAGRSVNPEKKGREWKFCCPFHADATPSCNYNPGLGCFQCFGCNEKGTSYKLFIKLGAPAGKETESTIRQMASHLGKTLDYIRPDAEAMRISHYCDRNGKLVKQEIRYPDRPDGSKDIRQRRPGRNGGFVWTVRGCKATLYNPQYLEFAGVIVFCDGPKDADTVTVLCLSGGRYVVVGTTSGWRRNVARQSGQRHTPLTRR